MIGADALPKLVIPARKGYPIEWREVDGQLYAYTQDASGRAVQATWTPQYGSQLAFMSATPIFEVLYEGTRGAVRPIAYSWTSYSTSGKVTDVSGAVLFFDKLTRNYRILLTRPKSGSG